MYSLHKVIKFYYIRLSILITILPRYLSERRKNQFVVKIHECMCRLDRPLDRPKFNIMYLNWPKWVIFNGETHLWLWQRAERCSVDRKLFLDRKPGYRDRRVWFLSHQSNYNINGVIRKLTNKACPLPVIVRLAWS